MFTIGDIKNIAVQIEKNGEKSYRQAAGITTSPEVSEMLLWMADQESNHAEWFSKLSSKKTLTNEQLELEEMGKSLLQEMVKGNEFLLEQNSLNQVETIKEVLSVSKIFEQDTILFYEFLLGLLDDEETCTQLQAIIDEERNHIEQIEIMERSNNELCDETC